jgi:hypothetical protein
LVSYGWCCRQFRTPGEHRVRDQRAKRTAPLWRTLAGLTASDWADATDLPGAQVAVADYRSTWWTNSSAVEFGAESTQDPARRVREPGSERQRVLTGTGGVRD